MCPLRGPGHAAAALYLLPVYLLFITGMKSFQEVSLARMWDLPSGLSLRQLLKAWFGSEAQGIRGLAQQLHEQRRAGRAGDPRLGHPGLDERLRAGEVEVPRRGRCFHPDAVRHVHPLPEHPDPAGADAAKDGAVRLAARPDLRPHRLRHPDHHADLPQLLRGDPDRADRGLQDRRRRHPGHLPPHPVPALAARLSSW